MTHLSTRRKGKKVSIPLVVASERGTAQTDPRGSLRALRGRGCRTDVVAPQRGRRVTNRAGSRMAQESPTVEGNSPVDETRATLRSVPE
jgi:hypothetical protein